MAAGLGTLVGGSLVLLAVLGFFGVAFVLSLRALSRLWSHTTAMETVEATVTSARVEPAGEGDGYAPRIEFRYRVDGEPYASDRVVEDGLVPSGDRNEMETYVERYPEMERVRAFVHPDEPGAAFLEPRYGPLDYARYVAAVLLTGTVVLVGGGYWALSVYEGVVA